MDIFDILTLIGGLCLFLFGMNVMGDGLERRAGGGLKLLLGKLTNNRMKGFLTGLGVTAVIQSSSATTVMVVGFVNSGLMTLKHSIGVMRRIPNLSLMTGTRFGYVPILTLSVKAMPSLLVCMP